MHDEERGQHRSAYSRGAHREMIDAIIDDLRRRLADAGWPDATVETPQHVDGVTAHAVRSITVGGRVYRIELDEAHYSYEVIVTSDRGALGSTYPHDAGTWDSTWAVSRLLLDDLRGGRGDAPL